MNPPDGYKTLAELEKMGGVFKEAFEKEVESWMQSMRSAGRSRRARAEAIRRLTEVGELNFEDEVHLELLSMQENAHLAAVQAEARRRFEAQNTDAST